MLKPELKVRLYKSIIRAILKYPVLPTCVTAKTNMLKLQECQNKSIKSATRNSPLRYATTETRHREMNIDPINQRFHMLAKRDGTN